MQTNTSTNKTPNNDKTPKAPETKLPAESSPAAVQAATLASGAALSTEHETDIGPVADPVSAGAVAYRAELSKTATPAFYAGVGRSLARSAARKSAKSAILAAISGKLS